MAKRKISCALTSENIDKLIKAVKFYESNLHKKLDLMFEKLGDLGIVAAEIQIQDAQGDTPKDACVVTFVIDDSRGTQTHARLTITSAPKHDRKAIMTEEGVEYVEREFYPHLAFEFGAGVRYNSNGANKNAQKFGMGPGTFPYQTHVPVPGYWFYTGHDGPSYGTEATQPMYHAWKEMKENVIKIAQEVFNG